jgi:hypothetical protein
MFRFPHGMSALEQAPYKVVEVGHCVLVGGRKSTGGDMRFDEAVRGQQLDVDSRGVEVRHSAPLGLMPRAGRFKLVLWRSRRRSARLPPAHMGGIGAGRKAVGPHLAMRADNFEQKFLPITGKLCL